MTDEISDIKKEVLKQFKDFQNVFLTTVEGEQPRVRPVVLICLDEKYWVTTSTSSVKVKQIRENPKIEFCLDLQKEQKGGYVRVAGTAEIVEEKQTKTKIAERCEFFSRHWKSVDDPEYTLLEICPEEVEYLRIGEHMVHKFNL